MDAWRSGAAMLLFVVLVLQLSFAFQRCCLVRSVDIAIAFAITIAESALGLGFTWLELLELKVQGVVFGSGFGVLVCKFLMARTQLLDYGDMGNFKIDGAWLILGNNSGLSYAFL